MPFTVSCPNCKTEYKLVDRVRGKKLRCKSCQLTFRAGPKLPTPQAVEVDLIQPVSVPVVVEPPGAELPLPVEAMPLAELPAELLSVDMISHEPTATDPIPIPVQPIPVQPLSALPIPVQPIPVQPIPVQPIPVQPIPPESNPVIETSVQSIPPAATAAPSVPIDIVLPQEPQFAATPGTGSNQGLLGGVPLVAHSSGDSLLHQPLQDPLAPLPYGNPLSPIAPSSFGQPVRPPRSGKTRREAYEESKPEWSGINWNGGAVAIGVGFLIMMLGIFGTVHSMSRPDGKGVLYFGAIIGGFLQMCYGFSNLK